MKNQTYFHSILFFATAAACLAALSACSPENATITARRNLVSKQEPIVQQAIPESDKAPIVDNTLPSFPADPIVWVTQDGGQQQLEFNPKTDIVFIIDNSESMKAAQDNLSRNINRFVEGFKKNKMIDFRIGVMSVWDKSDRYLKNKKDPYSEGELRLIKDTNGKTLDARYVSRFKGYEGALAKTLKIGIVPYAEGGPEVEEILEPLSQAIQKVGHGAVNEGFFRDEAHLVVVVVTDADDAKSSIAPEQMAEQLFQFKGGRKDLVSAYGVLTRKSDPDSVKDWELRVHPKYHPECFDGEGAKAKQNGLCKDGFGPERLEQFIIAANVQHARADDVRANQILALNQKDFGSDLAKIGSDITIRALRKEIFLDQRPRLDGNGQIMVRVRYGTKEQLAAGKGTLIPQQQNKTSGWVFDTERNSIVIPGSIQYEALTDAAFAVDLVPVKTAAPTSN